MGKIILFIVAAFFWHTFTFGSPEREVFFSELKAISNHDTDQRAELLNKIALTWFPAHLDSLMLFAREAYQLSQSTGNTAQEAEAARIIGVGHYALSELDSALFYYLEAERLFLLANVKGLGLARNYNNLAVIYDIRGDYERALEYYLKSLELNTALIDDRGIAFNLINIGLTQYNMGRLSQALDNLMEALRINQQRKDNNGIALALYNIAVIYNEFKEHRKAIDFHRQALEIRLKEGDMRLATSSYENLARIYTQIGEVDSAYYYFDKSLKLAQQIGNTRGEGFALVAFANFLQSQGDTQKAMEFFQKALPIARNMNDTHLLVSTFNGLAMISLQSQQINKAHEYARQSLQIARNADNLLLLRNTLGILAEILEKKGQFADALSYHKEFKLLSDSINNSEVRRRSARIDAEYEYMKKEQELRLATQEKDLLHRNRFLRQVYVSMLAFSLVAFLLVILFLRMRSQKKLKATLSILRNQNQQIILQKSRLQEQAMALESASETKSKLLSIIGHDLRGPLSYAAAALSLAENDPGFRDENLPRIRQSLERSYSLMENLLEWTKLQMLNQGNETEEFSLAQCADLVYLHVYTQADQKQITVENRIDPAYKIRTDKGMVELILRNLLSNAVKFSAPQSVVVIDCTEGNNEFIISVHDQGIGISEKMKQKLFKEKVTSASGTEEEKGSGLGLLFSQELLEKKGGKIWVETQEGVGSTFFFSLPSGN